MQPVCYGISFISDNSIAGSERKTNWRPCSSDYCQGHSPWQCSKLCCYGNSSRRMPLPQCWHTRAASQRGVSAVQRIPFRARRWNSMTTHLAYVYCDILLMSCTSHQITRSSSCCPICCGIYP